MALYATNRFAGDGTTTQYEINFVGQYIDRSHVKAYRVDNATQVRTPVVIAPGQWLNATTITGFAPTPVGQTLVIYRDTPKPPMVDFVNGSRLTEYNLDLVARQGLFVAMEALDAGGSEVRQALLETVAAVADLETAAAASAAIAAARADEVARLNLGPRASPPTTDDHGEPLLTGALYWDTSLPGMRSWNGSAWVTLPAATKASVGLANVDNTSDAAKPISNATQAALNGKQASLGFTPVQQGGPDGYGPGKVYIGWAADNRSGLLCQVDSTNFGNAWPISIRGSATSTVQYAGGVSAVRQAGDIGGRFVAWDTDAVVPAMQVDAQRADTAYMLWRATHWGVKHIAAMHVYEGDMSVTMSVGAPRNFIWYSNGDFQAAGNITAYSDIRLKTDITKITDALSKVSRLNGYTYTRKDTDARQTGVVAQEVLKVLPEAVIDNGEYLAVAYGNMVGLLIEAIKELKAEVDQLKGK